MKSRTLLLSIAVAVIGATLVAACSSGTTPDPFRLCGNGVINPGEQCDDGDSNSDFGACLTTCQSARCGDGFIYVATEQCDTNNFGYPDPRDPQTCKKLGFDGGTLLCTADCTFDTSECGPTFTPIPTVVHTFTPTSTSTPTPGTACGNGLIEDHEQCDTCPADCTVSACTPSASQATFTLNFAPPPGQDATSVTVLVGYRSNVISLPGSGSASSVTSRVKNKPSNSFPGINDLDYALRVVITRSSQIAPGRLFTVDFDTCAGAVAPAAADVSCSVEGCAGLFGPLDGCTCTVSGP